MQLPTIHGYFEASAALVPSACALTDGETSLTYLELEARANQLAHYLLCSGLQHGGLVGVLLDRSIDMVVAVLGICKAGGAYLPLGTEHPPQRLAYMLREAQASLLISRKGLASALPHNQSSLIDLDKCGTRISAQPIRSPAVSVQVGSPAFCIFTSGSTGEPKGVLVSHAGITPLVVAQRSIYRIVSFDRVLQFASFGFDAFLWDLLMAFGSGATLVLRREQSGEALVDFMVRERITIATLPPSLLVRLSFARVHSLRCLVTAGETCPPSVVGTLPPGCEFFNAYGPTEATICATVYRLPCDASGLLTLPIGRPIGATEVLILDGNLKPVQLGEAGEIYLGGPALAHGYLGRPELTAEKFIPHPSGAEGQRLYKTGDLARWLPSGDIEYIGRIDHQVKVRGYRIELGEIEAALLRLSNVREAAVIVREHRGHRVLVAFVVGRDRCSGRGLAQELGLVLPDWMLPAQWVFVDALPLNANGKVDRKVLEVRGGHAQVDCDDHQFEGGETEQILARLWAGMLGLKCVTLFDGFRSLGGSSIQAIDVAHQVGIIFGLGRHAPYPLGNVTVAEYAKAVDFAVAERRSVTLTDSVQSLPSRHMASYAQQQICFLEQWGEGWRAYRCHARFVLKGELKVDALLHALRALVQRHEILRTGFEAADGLWCRRIYSEVDVDIPFLDLSGDLSDKKFEAVMARELQYRFDLCRPPLIRWVLLKLSSEEHVLLQTEHHNIHDGLSFRILVSDLAEMYSAEAECRPALLPEVEGEYADYCLDERHWLNSSDYQRALDGWRDRLAAFSNDLRLFSQASVREQRRFVGAQTRIFLDDALAHSLSELAAREGMSLYSLMLAAFGLICGRYSGQTRFVIGSALANRTSPRFRRTVGMFVNMVPVPFELDECNASFALLLRRVSVAVDFALLHSAVPLLEIVKHLGWSQRLNGEAPFNVGFSFHDSLPAAPCFAGLDVRVDEALPNGSAKLDLNVTGILHNVTAVHPLELLFEYDEDIFSAVDVDRLIQGYRTVLAAIANDSCAPLSALDTLDVQHRAILRGWADGGEPNTSSLCVHMLFEEQVRRMPDAEAVVVGNLRLSYAELNRRSNQLGRRLHMCGVGPDTLVALCLERGLDMVIAMLAILKAGGAYVPLDPDYPCDRLAHMLSDSAAPVLITDTVLVDRLPSSQAHLLLLDAEWDQIAKLDDTNLPETTTPDHLAYCIYTSGSTGQPKGALNTHRGLANLSSWYFSGDLSVESERVLLASSLSFDLTQKNVLATLVAGGTLVIPNGHVTDLDALTEAVLQHRPTRINCTPSAFKAFFPSLSDSALRTVVLGGESFDSVLADEIARKGCLLVNSYGPTECADVAVSHVHWPESPAGSIPLGHPVPGVAVYVLDDQLRPVPVGVSGELCIAGIGVGRGYLNRPDLTAEKFVPDPFGNRGNRMYRTGDVARWRSDGNLEFLGRVDHQVKIRGFRIELGEIESSLLRHPGVREVVVLAREDAVGDRSLVAYVVSHTGSSVTPGELREHLLRGLPDYMQPSSWVVLDEMPLNPNGKIDRRALANSFVPTMKRHEYLRASFEHELPQLTTVLAILRELLSIEEIEPDDDLFSKGIHSVLIMRFVSRCRQQLRVELRLRDIYRLVTPLAIAQAIVDRQSLTS